MAVALNISDGKFKGSKPFEKSAVQEEFHADWGSTTFVEAGKAFSLGYRYCLMVGIHKDDCADAYLFFMADDKDLIMELVQPVFYSLKFQ